MFHLLLPPIYTQLFFLQFISFGFYTYCEKKHVTPVTLPVGSHSYTDVAPRRAPADTDLRAPQLRQHSS